MNRATQPTITVEITRGSTVESIHQGNAVVVDASGKIMRTWGDIEQGVFPRSAVKPLQAIALVESGAADAAHLEDKHIALACSSHNGEVEHVETVRNWLSQLNLSEQNLECGSHWPMFDQATRDMAARGESPDQTHNNCSGKHSGFLTLAQHKGWDIAGYTNVDHPLQIEVNRVIGEMCSVDMQSLPWGKDGCCIPTYQIPLVNIALGMARFANPENESDPRCAAIERIQNAMTQYPFMVAGTHRYCTDVMTACARRVLVKTGAEGVFCAALPEAGFGIALKCTDGATRAAEAMLTAILIELDVINESEQTRLQNRVHPTIKNRRDEEVGEIRVSLGD